MGPVPLSSVSGLVARVPRPWRVVQPPMPLNTFSPAATSCSGVTLAPRVSACGTSDCTWGILFAMSVYSASVPRTTPTILKLVAHTAGLPPFRRHERRLLREPAQPEHEGDERQEDQHAQADHLGRVAQRGRRGVPAPVPHHPPPDPKLADPGAGGPHPAPQPGGRG